MSTLKKKTTELFFDTSVLSKINWNGSEMALLKQLAKAGFVKLWISKTTYDELRTQWLDKFKTELNAALHFQKTVTKDQYLPKSLKAQVNFKKYLEKLDATKTSNKRFTRLLNDVGIKIIPHSNKDFIRTYDDYFEGKNAFKSPKSRTDIPDNWIYWLARRYFKNRLDIIYVINDSKLRSSIGDINSSIKVYETLKAVGESTEILNISSQFQAHLNWSKAKATINYEVIKQEIKSDVTEYIRGEVLTKRVFDNRIPSDDGMGRIFEMGTPTITNIDFDETPGAGSIFGKIAFRCEVSMSFEVHKSDAFTVPNWVNVNYVESEFNRYLDAEAQVPITGVVEFMAVPKKLKNYSKAKTVIQRATYQDVENIKIDV